MIVCVLGVPVAATGKWRDPLTLPPRSVVFLVLSALATGTSWLSYFGTQRVGAASQVAPVDKLSVVLVALFAATFLGERRGARGVAGDRLCRNRGAPPQSAALRAGARPRWSQPRLQAESDPAV